MKKPPALREPTSLDVRALARAIGRRCRGRTAVIGPEFPALDRRLRRQQVQHVVTTNVGELEERAYDSVVVANTIESMGRPVSIEFLRQAFERVAPRGRLLVCVPNGDLGGLPGDIQRFSRTTFKKLLKTIDQPKEFNDQPFAWLLMALHRDPVLDRAVADRCEAIANLCHGRVAELGCGPGHLSAAIAARGLEVCGIDMNVPKIAAARCRYPGIKFHQADILTWSADKTFDTVVLAEVLEHVAADVGDRMLDKAWSLVGPQGRLVVSVPNENCIPHPNHVREFVLEDLTNMLRRFGVPQVEVDQPFKWLLVHVDHSPKGNQENGS